MEKRAVFPQVELLRALQANDLKTVRLFFSRFSSNSQRTKWLSTPLENSSTFLHFAIETDCSPEIVSLLIELAPQLLNTASSSGTFPIHVAVEKGNLPVLEEMLLAEKRFNNSDYHVLIDEHRAIGGDTALHIATRRRNVQLVQLLLECGADCDAKDKNDVTPLMIAVMNSDKACVLELLRYGANLKLRNKQNQNALYMAMKVRDDHDIVRLLTVSKPPVIQRRRVRGPEPALPPAHKSPNDHAESFVPRFDPRIADPRLAAPSGRNAPVAQVISRDIQLELQHKREQEREREKEALANRRAPRLEGPAPSSASSTVTMSEAELFYPMKGSCRGVCVVINNETYESKELKNRGGTDADERSLRRAFGSLGFQLKVYKNLRANDIYWTMIRLAELDHSAFDCFVCVFLAHGAEGKLFGVDGDEVPLTTLTEPFTNEKCVSLRGKPKLFFVQACRGEVREFADTRLRYENDDRKMPSGRSEESEDAAEVRRALASIPRFADFLISYATVYGYVAQRHDHDGSVYIQALCYELEKYGKTYDLHTVLTRINHKVSKMEFRDKYGFLTKQMPETRYTLTRQVKFW